MVRYHGVLSSHARARAEVVPKAEATAVRNVSTRLRQPVRTFYVAGVAGLAA